VNARLKAAGGHSPFPTIDQISVDVKALGLDNQWFWATTALVLTGELILCAEQGGTLSSKTCFSEPEAIAATQTIEILRNAVCHPGHVSHSSSGRPHVQALADHLERYAKEHLSTSGGSD
jgi:hypothetical protein